MSASAAPAPRSSPASTRASIIAWPTASARPASLPATRPTCRIVATDATAMTTVSRSAASACRPWWWRVEMTGGPLRGAVASCCSRTKACAAAASRWSGLNVHILHGRNDSFGATSAVIEGGQWLLCAHSSFHGNCIELGPGRYDNLAQAGLARPVLSAQPVAMSAGRGGWQGWDGREGRDDRAGYGLAAVELFSERDFGGQRYSADGDVQALRDFNDRAASAIVHIGQWEFCGDFDYRGGCAVYDPGRYPALGALTRHLSSVRRVR